MLLQFPKVKNIFFSALTMSMVFNSKQQLRVGIKNKNRLRDNLNVFPFSLVTLGGYKNI